MIAGRLVWAFVKLILLGVNGIPFGWEIFVTVGFLNALPGILLQLTAIPALMVALNRAKIVPFHRGTAHQRKHAHTKTDWEG